MSGVRSAGVDGDLVLEGVRFGYGRGADVLGGVDARVGVGLTCVLGPNGAGKSTLARLMAGLLRARSGRVLLGGADVWRMGGRERARRVAFVAQRPAVSASFTVREVVGMGRIAWGRGAGDAAAVERAMEVCELGELAGRVFGVLSAGQQQRVAMARAVAQLDGAAGGVLIADEPVSAMDPRYVSGAFGVMRGVVERGGRVVVVAHDVALAGRVADRVVLLGGDGRVAGAGEAGEVLTAGLLGEVYGARFERARLEGGGEVLVGGV